MSVAEIIAKHFPKENLGHIIQYENLREGYLFFAKINEEWTNL
jgi:hypothetical protein